MRRQVKGRRRFFAYLPIDQLHYHTAMEGGLRAPFMIHEFQESLKAHPPIPPGASDGFIPAGDRAKR